MSSAGKGDSKADRSVGGVFEVHRNPWFSVKNRDGFYTLEYDQEQNVVLPVVDERYILLIRSIRPVINDTPWELPAGGTELGEEPVSTVRRELAEEAGVYIGELSRFERLPRVAEMPGRMPQLLNVFKIDLSMQEYESRGDFDAGEVVGVEIFSFAEIARMLRDNTIYLAPVSCILSRFLLSGIDLSVFERGR